MKRTAVVIATYNEALNAPELVGQVKKWTPEVMVLVVDDNSPDGTAKSVQDLNLPDVHVLIRRNSRGYGTAVRDGLLRAVKLGADQIITMDADFSHEPKALPDLIEALEHADMAVGSRYAGGVRVINWQIKRLLLSLFANLYVRTILGFPIQDCTTGYRAYRRNLILRMRLKSIKSNGYSFLVEMVWRAIRSKARIVEVPIVFVERREGESKMSGSVIWESIWMPWRLRFFQRRP